MNVPPRAAAVADFRLAVQTLEENVVVTGGAIEGGGRSAACLDAWRRHGRGRQRAVFPAYQRDCGHAALRARHVRPKQLRFRRTLLFESWLQSRRHRLRQERYQAAPGWIAGHDSRRQQSQSCHRPVDRALRQRGARRERAHLRRQHTGRRDRFHLSHRAQQRAALSVPRRRQLRFPERPSHDRRCAREDGRAADDRRQAVGRLSRSQQSGTLGRLRQRRLATVDEDAGAALRNLRLQRPAPARRAHAR